MMQRTRYCTRIKLWQIHLRTNSVWVLVLVKVSYILCPALPQLLLSRLSVANVTSSNITVDIRVYDSSANAHAHVIKTGDVFVGGTLVVVGGDQKLEKAETGDQIKVTASASSSADVIVSYMEQT